MQLYQRLVLLTLGLILSLFVADKIFLLRSVQIRTQKDPTYLYYQHKYDLIDKLALDFSAENVSRRQALEEASIHDGSIAEPSKLLVVIGSSRMLFFDYQTFRRSHPQWDVYNFSVPVNSPAYYAFILERLYEKNIRPDFLILESDPFQFNEYSPGFRQSNLQYSFDLRFIASNFNRLSRDDVSRFLGLWLFAGMKYPPHPDRLKMLVSGTDRFLPLFVETERYTKENHGCGFSPIPVDGWFEKDFSTLAVSSKGTVGWLYGNYTMSEVQWQFFDDAVTLAHRHNTPLLIIRPQVSRPMQRILDEETAVVEQSKVWQERLDAIRGRSPFLDLSSGKPYDCNAFVDGAHMAVECYDPVLDVAMNLLPLAEKAVGDQ